MRLPVSEDAFAGKDAVVETTSETAFVRLVLTHFRGFRELSLALDPAPVVLTGPNGAGKTNLLEAISMFGPGGGIRQARLGEIDLRLPGNASGMAWAVHAELVAHEGTVSLGTGRDPLAPQQSGRERRLCRVNGAPVKSQTSFADYVSIQWLVPAMDRLFDDGKSQRRRFLDRMVAGVDPGHALRVTSYETALRERGRVLRGEVEVVANDRAKWLDGLESEMASLATAIAASRLETVRLLNQILDETAGPFPRVHLGVSGEVEEWLQDDSALAVEDRLRSSLMQSREQDLESGITRWGTHRSDLDVHYAGRELGGRTVLACDCSTGEQKALLISMALAESRLMHRMRGQKPILLLDEALAHLDRRRCRDLFDEILALGQQVWLTGVEPTPFQDLAKRAQFIGLENGQATAYQD